jgi:hypothetical protein
MQKLKISTWKIDKSHLYEGKNGKYLNCVLFENRDGQSEYGDDGFIVQEVSKEAREAGERGPIIGNWRHLDTKGGGKPSNRNTAPEAEDENVPF